MDWYAPPPAKASKVEKGGKPCQHTWIASESDGEEICIKCGLVGQQVYSTSWQQDQPSPLLSDDRKGPRLDLLRDETTEIIMRISGGDCASTHVDAVMRQLHKWHDDADRNVKELISRIGHQRDSVSRGIFAVAIQHGLLHNGRCESLDLISSVVGASRHSVQAAEKLLRVSRCFSTSRVFLHTIIDQIDGLAWKNTLMELALSNAKACFREADVNVAAVGLALGREMKLHLGKMKKRNLMTGAREKLIRAQLRCLSGASLCRALRLTYSTVNRASKAIDGATRTKLTTAACHLL